jgi:Tol biopolymer transport system component
MIKTWLIFPLLFSQALLAQNNSGFVKSAPAPVLLTEININTNLRERDFALSPDGNEVFYTLQSPVRNFQTIIYLKKDNKGSWSKPEVAPFAGRYSDLEPAFTIDGKRLFFASNRPVTGNQIKDFDIWYVEKENGRWGDAKNAGNPVNTPNDEYYPSVAKCGNLYFTAAYEKATGKEDIYLSVWENGKYKEPVPLDSAVNSATYEFNAFISPDEQFIIFTSYGRKDDKGGGDLYMSIKDANGKWMPAKNLVTLNSDKLDYCPFVSFDKKTLYFTSERHILKDCFSDRPAAYSGLMRSFSNPLNGGGNIYRVNFEELMLYMH